MAPAKRSTDSMTSKKTSFFLYLIPSGLQETAFVTAGGGLKAPGAEIFHDKSTNQMTKHEKKHLFHF